MLPEDKARTILQKVRTIELRPPVAQLVGRKFRNIHTVKIHLPDLSVRHHPVGRRHIPYGDGMQHGSHAEHRGGFPTPTGMASVICGVS